MICRNCNTENHDDSRFCKICGFALKSGEVQPIGVLQEPDLQPDFGTYDETAAVYQQEPYYEDNQTAVVYDGAYAAQTPYEEVKHEKKVKPVLSASEATDKMAKSVLFIITLVLFAAVSVLYIICTVFDIIGYVTYDVIPWTSLVSAAVSALVPGLSLLLLVFMFAGAVLKTKSAISLIPIFKKFNVVVSAVSYMFFAVALFYALFYTISADVMFLFNSADVWKCIVCSAIGAVLPHSVSVYMGRVSDAASGKDDCKKPSYVSSLLCFVVFAVLLTAMIITLLGNGSGGVLTIIWISVAAVVAALFGVNGILYTAAIRRSFNKDCECDK